MPKKMSEERLNRIEAKLNNLEERLRTLELDVEPDGRISESFQAISPKIDSLRLEMSDRFTQINKRLDRLEQFRQDTRETLALILRRLSS